MKHLLPKLISTIIHPLLIPTFAILYFFTAPSFLALLSIPLIKIIVTIVFISTTIAPVLFAILLYYLKITNSLTLKNQKDRIFPLTIAAMFYITCFIILQRLPIGIPNIVTYYILASAVAIIATIIINIFTKVSAHMMSIAGTSAYLLLFNTYMQIDTFYLIIILILTNSIVAYSRLQLGAHTPKQIIIGGITGFTIALSTIFIL